jgi:hypothetical protein
MNVSGQQSAPTRAGEELRTLNGIDDCVRKMAKSFGALEVQYPVLIARDILDRAEYPKAFPHLLMSACSTADPEGGHPIGVGIAAHTWCLSPAVCYHAYEQLAGRVLGLPTAVTARSRCFRAERETSPGVRQSECEMREIVLLGPAGWVDASADAARGAVEAIARDMALAGEWHAAEDPFFLPMASGKALMQRLLTLKVEYQWPGAGGLALASVNRHGTFFGKRFDITTPDGQPVQTACIAVGLDRWAHHARWPQGGQKGEAIQ